LKVTPKASFIIYVPSTFDDLHGTITVA
jgi:hypothetical protein